MGSLADHHSNAYVKLLAIGNPKTGKTGALTSLVKAGYKLRILDLDNLLDILSTCVRRDCPELLGNVEYRSLRDKRKAGPGGWTVQGQPKAFPETLKMLDRWRYTEDGVETDLGVPSEWGPDCILVIDSLSRLCDAALLWAETVVQRGRDGQFDGRALVGQAQRGVEPILSGITSENFRTNVIVIAHVDYYEMQDGTEKGFPRTVGKKLSPNIPSYFPNVVLFEQDKSGKRGFRTNSTPMVDLANIKPFATSPTYPIETGLADFFRVLAPPPGKEPRQAEAPQETATPTIHLKRA